MVQAWWFQANHACMKSANTAFIVTSNAGKSSETVNI
jgi:hypothetical protein